MSNATVNNGSGINGNLFDGDITTKINITGGYIEIDLSSRNFKQDQKELRSIIMRVGAYTSYQVNGGTGSINWQDLLLVG